MSGLKQPIFIVGVGRSGSTVFHEIFARHPNVAWLSRFCDKYPSKPAFNKYFMQALDWPVLSAYLRKINPEECYDFWETHVKGFRHPCRDLVAGDVTEKTRKKLQGIFPQFLTTKRNRLLIKLTGWPRVGFVKEVFGDAKFIHVIRDGRAVANSLINLNWWWGWRGPQNWRWGELPAEYRAEWEQNNRSFLALACIEWKMIMDAMEKAKDSLSQENLMEIKYEDLCRDTPGTFDKVLKFCELDHSAEFSGYIKGQAVRSANTKWEKELTSEQKQIMTKRLEKHLSRYGY